MSKSNNTIDDLQSQCQQINERLISEGGYDRLLAQLDSALSTTIWTSQIDAIIEQKLSAVSDYGNTEAIAKQVEQQALGCNF